MLGFGKKKRHLAPEGFEVPSFPTTVLNVLGKLRDPEISSNELAHELEIDPGLHVRVLKVVNSAAFGLSHKVSNITHAVNLLGRGRLEALVLSVATQETLSKNNKAAWLNMKDFWATAARRAALARGLAVELHPHVRSDVFTIGLLEDMGVPVLANKGGNRYRDIYQDWLKNDDVDLVSYEQQQYGTNHASIGAQVAKYWGFPDSLSDAIGHHHQFDDSELPLSIKVASLVRGATEDSHLIAEKAEQLFGLGSRLTVDLIERVLDESGELAAALG
ncbi:HD-like signal output (HDOD) domain, no enzymatic activity [Malonomonas rubra DSM 5091]|uniref:HD-like signal output (HDOD) domain, no enzymatic activity n=1 Tax=Malonomonas rubra DSM 5091 TaxID=1122189 RepID=A0A1M6IN83_MALRU|nr:HDOD domain-containing protein [Malonomonas rubra]SHJ35809.1 HD-like signal output (HDOD) domain, no enzymatic activity [Malonomonas rubra DSM 5091]